MASSFTAGKFNPSFAFGGNAPTFNLAGKFGDLMKPKSGGQAPAFAPQTPEGKLVESLGPLMQKQIEQNIWASSPEGMKAQLEMAREDAKEKAKQGLMWSTLAKLPETMANAVSPYGGPVGAAMAYQGMSAIPGIYANTLAYYPQIQAVGSSTQQYRYF